MNEALPSGAWLQTTEASFELGISRYTLQKHVQNGNLEYWSHYYQLGNKKTAPMFFNVEAVRSTLARLAAPDAARGVNHGL